MKIKLAAVSFALSLGFVLDAAAQAKPDVLVKQRQAAMTLFGKYFGPLLRNLKKEVFKIVLLDSQNTMMRDVTISEGSLDKSIVHPREVFKPAIRESAAAIILIHNHPSGDTEPSGHDKAITEKLAATGEVVGIRVLDHIIIGKKGYFSFCDKLLL